MKRVTRDEWWDVIKSLPYDWMHSESSTDMSVCQYLNPQGDLIAQAVNRAGQDTQYFLEETVIVSVEVTS